MTVEKPGIKTEYKQRDANIF